MRKRKSSVPEGPRPNDGWEIQTEMTINGRHVKPGTIACFWYCDFVFAVCLVLRVWILLAKRRT